MNPGLGTKEYYRDAQRRSREKTRARGREFTAVIIDRGALEQLRAYCRAHEIPINKTAGKLIAESMKRLLAAEEAGQTQ